MSTAASMAPNGIASRPETKVGNNFIANYPPFSCWNREEIPNLLRALCQPAEGQPLCFYIHLPFCRQRCHYCYFRVYPRRSEEDIDLYISSLLKELAMYMRLPALRDRDLRAVYFGGGTPSYLTASQIETLFGGLREKLSWDHVEECTFECEPGTVDPGKLAALKKAGATRLSLGFQSLDEEVLRRSGRGATVEDCQSAFHLARAAGFEELNVDLLAGLPGETDATWKNTIRKVIDLAPDCVTIYQLELTYNSTLFHSIQHGRVVALPDWREKRSWTREAFAMLEAAGYTVCSGYMAVRNPARWRFVYTVEQFWRGNDLLSLGESAFGHFQGVHYQNVDHFDDYTRLIGEGKFPLSRALKLKPEEQLHREVILQLKTGALDAAYFREKFDVELLEKFSLPFRQLIEAGLADIDRDRLVLHREGLLQADQLLPLFYLPEHIGKRYT